MNYTFHPGAEAEFLESIAFYEAQAPGLGAAFIDEFDAVITLVCKAPKQWQVERKPDIRRALLHRFPFSIVYRERSGEIQILAIAHSHRRHQYWLIRA